MDGNLKPMSMAAVRVLGHNERGARAGSGRSSHSPVLVIAMLELDAPRGIARAKVSGSRRPAGGHSQRRAGPPWDVEVESRCPGWQIRLPAGRPEFSFMGNLGILGSGDHSELSLPGPRPLVQGKGE